MTRKYPVRQAMTTEFPPSNPKPPDNELRPVSCRDAYRSLQAAHPSAAPTNNCVLAAAYAVPPLRAEAQREVYMEHRWGIRRTLGVGVKLYVRSQPPRLSRLLNASSSGAYVATNSPLRIMTRVRLALGWDRFQRADRHRIAAYVVRSDARGIGIEWQEFAPLPMLALMDAPQGSLPQNSFDRIRNITEARDEFAYIPWSRPDSTFGDARNGG
jgi:hypothetical protein